MLAANGNHSLKGHTMSKLYEVSWQQGHDSRKAVIRAWEVELARQQRLRVEPDFVEATGPDPEAVMARFFEELDTRLSALPSVDDEAAVEQMFREIDEVVPSTLPAHPERIPPIFLKPNSDDAEISRAIRRNIGGADVVVRPL